jgi:hypothetical protein
VGAAVNILLLAVIAAPQLTGPPAGVEVASAVFSKAHLDVVGKVVVASAGRVSGAGIHAARAELSIEGPAGVRRTEAYGFGQTEESASRDAVLRAAREAAAGLALLDGARPYGALPDGAMRPPTVDPGRGTLVVARGLTSFAALEGLLEFVRSRDSKAEIALLIAGSPVLRLPDTTSASSFLTAVRRFVPPGHALAQAKVEGRTVTLVYGPPPDQGGPEKTASPPSPTVDDEDLPRP